MKEYAEPHAGSCRRIGEGKSTMALGALVKQDGHPLSFFSAVKV